ncbi:MAG TPA: hypothetical protein VGQ18_02315 [Gemmatimonadales bacterium]|jgi:hypothetical protein|nr:hypothetical protein [Gemmatimonadales bacterium]
MRTSRYAIVLVGAAALGLGVGCLPSTDLTGFVFQYGVATFDCDTTCGAPGPDTISTAARGDTVWVRHQIVLVQSINDSSDATLRPTCVDNVAIRAGVNTVKTLPAPAGCALDSTDVRRFALGGILTRYTQWVVDSSLTPAPYVVVGRILVHPLIEPQLTFTVMP